ncbi:MAG: fibronectin type III domain-containing protein [Acidobacteria bacterium]|nr:fibronectin type III domain-containing protein [Acidobacteriota bacterium]MDW7983542.1 fibronectin type III domain-containing protein [Acidobacteriota bacterium]
MRQWGLLVLAGWLSYGVACGKKGPPLPPLPQIPSAPSDWGLRCIGSACGLWMAPPDRNTDGSRPVRIGWVLLVADGASPPFQPERALAAWRFSPSEVYPNGRVWWGALARWPTECVRLVLLNHRRKSGPPTEAVCPVSPEDGLPPDVRVDTTPQGIRLSWPESPSPVVLEVYRIQGDGPGPGRAWPWSPYAVVEAGQTAWTDEGVRDGESWTYGVRRQTRRDAHLWVASTTRTVGPIRYEDVFPPPPPDHLTGFVEADRLVLVWDPVTAPDLAGYFVYMRPVGAPAWERLNDRPTALTRYEVHPAGAADWKGRVEFAITSVDRKGNESPKSLTWAYGNSGIRQSAKWARGYDLPTVGLPNFPDSPMGGRCTH